MQTPYIAGGVHFYTAEAAGELILFDTGPDTPEALALLQEQVDIERLKYLFITHGHADHYGLAAYISQHSAAEIFLPRIDAIKLQHREERLMHIQKLLKESGFDEEFASRLWGVFEKNKLFPSIPGRCTIVEESDVPQKLGISWISCPGHSQSDLVYLYGSHAVTGDVLLRNVFQIPLLDVDMETFEGRFRNYDAYCTSLLELEKLRLYEISPGHREFVESVDDTICFYVRKILERSGQVKKYAGVEPVCDIIRHLFREPINDPFFVFAKVSEIVFMRDFLFEPYKLKNSMEQIGLFSAVSDLYAALTE